MSNQLQRIELQTNYRTPAGFEFKFGDIMQGVQSRIGGNVEVRIEKTGERVCFSARECGLPVPSVEVIDLAAA